MNIESRLRFLIVDDEELSRSYIAALIHELCPDDIIVASVNNITKANEIINAEKVDVLFLDVMMPGGNGFDLLASISHERNIKVVFITAYSQYAIKAIRENALDYLLKPVDKDDFSNTIQKIKARQLSAGFPENSSNNWIAPSPDYLSQKLSIHHSNGFKILTLKSIIFMQAANNYTVIKLVSGETIIVSRPLKHFENQFDPAWFFRIHKSYIININCITEYISKDGGYVLMNSGDKIYVSRYKLTAFFDTMSKVTNGFKA